MFWHSVVSENAKIFRRTLFWVEIILLALIVLGILLALFITVETDRSGSGLLSDERRMLLETLTWPEAWSNVIRLAGWDGLGPLFLIILVGAVTAQEYTWRTLHIPLSRGVPRPLLIMAKLTALFIAGLLVVFSVLAVGGIATAVFSTIVNGSLRINELDYFHLFLSAGRAIFTLLPYGCLTFLLAVASRSAVAAISGGLVYIMVLENLIISSSGLLGERFSQLVLYLPGGLANSLLILNKASLGMSSNSEMSVVSPLNAAVGITAWTLLFIGISLFIFQRQDLAE